MTVTEILVSPFVLISSVIEVTIAVVFLPRHLIISMILDEILLTPCTLVPFVVRNVDALGLVWICR